MSINAPLATAPVAINLPLNQPGSQIAGILNAHAVRLDTDETNITNNATAISSLQSSVTVLQTDNTTNKANIATLQGQMATANTNIANNTAAINALVTRMNAAEANITTLQNTVIDLQNQIDALTTRVGTNESNIAALFAHDSTQDQALSDLDHRVTALEQGGSVSKGGPFIGDLVHITDANGHCQPSIVYEDWDGRNATGTISVAVLSPIRLSESPWDSYIEVRESTGPALPFTTWHWPEMAFQYRRNLFRRIAERAG